MNQNFASQKGVFVGVLQGVILQVVLQSSLLLIKADKVTRPFCFPWLAFPFPFGLECFPLALPRSFLLVTPLRPLGILLAKIILLFDRVPWLCACKVCLLRYSVCELFKAVFVCMPLISAVCCFVTLKYENFWVVKKCL